MKYARRLAPSLLLVALIAPRDGDSCGPFLFEAQFTTYHGPVEAEFSSGQMGVLRPHFYREPLVAAWRALSGMPPTGGQRAALLPKEAVPAANPHEPRTPMDRWLAARLLVPGAAVINRIDPDKTVPGTDYQFYVNCLDDAFDAAAATLRRRIGGWGASSPMVAEWLRGQDRVFQNCSAGPSIPAQVPEADPLLAADRAYQIAAAQFYAQQYSEAAAGFTTIAADPASPWREIAPYLAARVCIREGTLGKNDDKLREAERRLRQILDDPARQALHSSVEGLLEFVRGRLDPQARITELGVELMKPGVGPRFARAITDYTMLWDRLDASQIPPPVAESELADWIQSFQHGQDGSHAFDRWRSTRTLPWLVAAVVWARPADPQVPELLAAARAVHPDSPAWATVTYYGIRLRIARGESDPARVWADEALATKPPDSVANLLRAERSRLARNWTEFLRAAPRKPVALYYGDGFGDDPIGEPPRKSVAFDADTVRPMNETVPLERWIAAARSPLLPRTLQADVAQAGWVRAVILGDAASARGLAARLAQLAPALAGEMRAWLDERDPAAANFAAVFLMLRAPGLTPLLRPGLGRETPVLRRDQLRDNWWTLAPRANPGYRDPEHDALFDLYPDGNFGSSDFLSREQRAEGAKQWTQLVDAAGNSVNFLATRAIAWARAHPRDPRVPEALHLVVEATHYGPTNDQSSAYSRQAFELLHRRYPQSEWTRKTRYWY